MGEGLGEGGRHVGALKEGLPRAGSRAEGRIEHWHCAACKNWESCQLNLLSRQTALTHRALALPSHPCPPPC